MPTLPLFYRTVVPLDRHAHRAWRLARLHRGGWLPAIHAHLVSLQAASDFTHALAPPGRSASAPRPLDAAA